MDKLRMHSVNKVDENIAKIGAMFPNCLTERKNENGEVEYAVDFDILKQELSSVIVEGNEERYQFTWPDKKKSILLANAPIAKTLRPCREESVDFDTTENLYIEGDNLDVLKLLQETYLGKIKMIYIDPPYNTGNDFVYNDDFSEDTDTYLANSGQFDADGNRLVANTESNGRFHTDWLNMIYPRLKLAKDLLTDDGAIFISIDDNEVENLKKICNEIFGEDCFVADLAWQKTYAPKNNNQSIAAEVEYILVYSKQNSWISNKLPRTDSMNSKYKNPDNDEVDWRTDNSSAPGAATHQGMVYAIQNPFDGRLLYPPKGRCWCREQSVIFEALNKWASYELRDIHDECQRAEVCGVSEDEVRKNVKSIMLSCSLEEARAKATILLENGPWPLFYFTNNGKGGLARKSYIDKVQDRVPTNLWRFDEVGHTDEAKKEIKDLFGGSAPFDTPKPTRLLSRILEVATDSDSLVLDFFSGSATTAHSVFQKNACDNGNRRFILVQLPEDCSSDLYSNLCEVGKERIRRAGAKIKEESPLTTQNLDTGFRVLKLSNSNMKDVYYSPADYEISMFDTLADNIKEDRTPEDLLFQVMLDLGVLLSSKIEESTIAGKKVFNVADGFLMACFDENVSDETITAVAKQKPYYFIMRDSSLASDSVATNFDQIFATYSPDTVRKVL